MDILYFNKLRKDIQWCIQKIKCLLDKGCECDCQDNLDIYSTEEIVVGTWIDGRPIYRKVIQETWNPIDTPTATFFPFGSGGNRYRKISVSAIGTGRQIVRFNTFYDNEEFGNMTQDIATLNEAVLQQISSGIMYSYINGFFSPNNLIIQLHYNSFSTTPDTNILFTHIIEYVKPA